jgi:hypothetical protein
MRLWGRPPGGRSPPKRATVIGIKLKPAHKHGYFVINHKQIALLLADPLIQSCFFKTPTSNSISIRGSAPGPMQGEVSPYDPLFSAHPASSSQQQSLCGTQNNPPRNDDLKYPYSCIVPGQGFALKAAESLSCLAPHACRLKENPNNRISSKGS